MSDVVGDGAAFDAEVSGRSVVATPGREHAEAVLQDLKDSVELLEQTIQGLEASREAKQAEISQLEQELEEMD